MSVKESVGANSRQCSIESGLTQVIGPVLVCIPEKKIKDVKVRSRIYNFVRFFIHLLNKIFSENNGI